MPETDEREGDDVTLDVKYALVTFLFSTAAVPVSLKARAGSSSLNLYNFRVFMFVMRFTSCTYAQWSIVTLQRAMASSPMPCPLHCRLRRRCLRPVVADGFANPHTAVDCLTHAVLRELHIFSHLLGNKNVSQGI